MKTTQNWRRRSGMLFLSLFVAAVSWAIPGHAPDFQVGSVYYYVDEDDPTAVNVTYKFDAQSGNHKSYSGEVTIPSQVEYDGKTYTVKGIAPGAFSGCDVTAVNLPNTLTWIGFEAFIYCASLTELTIPSSVTTIENRAFYHSAIKKIQIPSGVTKLAYETFLETPLEEITLPMTLKEIEYSVFFNCTKLKHIILPTELEILGEKAFHGCSALEDITIPNSVKSIGLQTFHKCTSLRNVLFTQPSSVESIGDQAFYLTGLVAVNIPESVTSIGDMAFLESQIADLSFRSNGQLKTIGTHAFQSNPLSTNIVLPASVESIGAMAFRFCKSDAGFSVKFEEGGHVSTVGDQAFYESSLKSVTFPASLRTLGASVFERCSNLTGVGLQDGLQSIGDRCFYYLSGLTQKIHIASSVTSIGKLAFLGCGSLEIDLNTATENVGQSAFCGVQRINITDADSWMRLVARGIPFIASGTGYGHAKIYKNGELLTSYVLPEGIERIEDKAFYRNTDITSITLPNSLTYIGEEAFNYCSALETVVFGNSLEEVGKYAFKNCSAITTVDIGDLANWCEVWFPTADANPLGFARKIILKGTQLGALNIPTKVTKIGNFTFYNCRLFDSVTIPNNVASIGAYAFAGCADLEKVTFGNSPKLETIGIHAFDGTALTSISLPSTVTAIENGAFYNCKMLESVTIPEKVTQIEDHTFWYCTKLAQVALPEGLKAIRKYAFYECSSLGQIDVPVTLESIGWYAFSGVQVGLHIKDFVKWLQVERGFAWCKAQRLYLDGKLVTELTIPDGVTQLKNETFMGNHDLRTLVVPEGVKVIGDSCFQFCDNLRSIHVPTTLERVGRDAFYFSSSNTYNIDFYTDDLASFINSGMACSISPIVVHNVEKYGANLYLNGELVTNLIIPEGVKALGENAFKNFLFKNVVLPSSLESISGSAFWYCYAL